MPLRGKVLSALKHDLAKILSNAEVEAMIKAIGLKLEGDKVIFDEKALRYHKVIIMTDGDVDGRVSCQ